jgi:hypothetical protein
VRLKQVVMAALIGTGLLGAGFWLGSAVAGTAEPGSAADPLVSKSYVDQLVAKFVDRSYVDNATAPLASKAYVDGRVSFQVVNLPKGATLLGESGTELVLRGGKATVVTTPKGGVLDATAGMDMPQGFAVPPNHLLVIPVGDGRGLTAEVDAILIVKGAYTIKPAP